MYGNANNNNGDSRSSKSVAACIKKGKTAGHIEREKSEAN